MLSTLISLFLAVLPASVQAYSNPGSCTGHCWAHDPSLIQRSSDGVYFLFNTGGAIGISKASSLAGPWTYEGNAIASGKSSIDLTGNTDLWAPDVQKVGSTYYLFYAVSTFGTQVSAIGYATSTTLEAGSWTDHGSLGVASKAGSAYNAIDPNLVLVGSTYYLTFGSFWNDIYQVKLANPPTKTTGTASYQVAYDTSGDHPAEGSFVYYYGGYYYLLWSQGICCGYATSKPAAGAEYKIMITRSSSATGGFVDKNGVKATAGGGTILLASHGIVYGPGGQGIFTNSAGQPVLYYHYASTTVGLADADYLFGYNVLSWSNGWPSV